MAAEQQLSDVLSEFAHTMVTDFQIQAILEHLVERIVDIMPVTAAGVTLISPGAAPHYIAASDPAALRFEELQTELSEGPCLEAYRTGHAVAVPDLRNEDRFASFGPRASAAGLGAVFTFPLHHGEQRLGALDLYRDTAGEMSPAAMDTAETLADVAASYLLISQARTGLQDSSDQARDAALHDPLTGLPNRVLLLDHLERAFARARRGDELLVAVTERLTGLLRSSDTLARLHGDEFVILCEDIEKPSQADRIVARLHASLASPLVLSGVEIDITASVGIAFAGHDPTNPEQLIHDADTAMYRAKRAGGGRHQVLDLRAPPHPRDRRQEVP